MFPKMLQLPLYLFHFAKLFNQKVAWMEQKLPFFKPKEGIPMKTTIWAKEVSYLYLCSIKNTSAFVSFSTFIFFSI